MKRLDEMKRMSLWVVALAAVLVSGSANGEEKTKGVRHQTEKLSNKKPSTAASLSFGAAVRTVVRVPVNTNTARIQVDCGGSCPNGFYVAARAWNGGCILKEGNSTGASLILKVPTLGVKPDSWSYQPVIVEVYTPGKPSPLPDAGYTSKSTPPYVVTVLENASVCTPASTQILTQESPCRPGPDPWPDPDKAGCLTH